MGVDPHASARLGGANDIFGETPVLTVWHLLRWTESALGSVPEPFVDLGAGRGVPSLVAACLGFDAIGYERETSWVERAREVAVELRLEAHFEAVDFLTAAWPDAGTFYATTTSWDRDQKEAMVERLGRGEGPRAVLLLDGPTLTGDFDQYWSRTVPVGWGRARADLWHRQGCPVKPRNDA